MTLSTYSGLLTSIAGWLMRDDLTDVIPDFITLAETDMNQRLRLRCMLTRATAVLDDTDGYETLPTDFLQMYRLTLDGGEISYAPAIPMTRLATDWAGSSPMYFTILGEQLQFVPAGASLTGALEMTYYARPEALSDDNQTNALLLASPALYLYGALVQSAPYLGDDQRVQTWATLYQEAANVLQAADDAAEMAGPLVIRFGSGDMAP